MKRIILIIFGLIISYNSYAQVPFFASVAEKNSVYTSLTMSYTPSQEDYGAYLYSHFSVLDNLSLGFEVVASPSSITQGFGVKYNFIKRSYLTMALQTTTSMDLKNDYNFSAQSSGLFIMGDIYKSLSYVSNTYMDNYRNGDISMNQFWYLYYTYKWFSPYVGFTHNWIGEMKPDLTIGFNFTVKNMNIYLWGGNLTSSNIKVSIGVDYVFNVKKR